MVSLIIELKKLLNSSTQNTAFQFDNKFYKQLDGVAVGSLDLWWLTLSYTTSLIKPLQSSLSFTELIFFCRY